MIIPKSLQKNHRKRPIKRVTSMVYCLGLKWVNTIVTREWWNSFNFPLLRVSDVSERGIDGLLALEIHQVN